MSTTGTVITTIQPFPLIALQPPAVRLMQGSVAPHQTVVRCSCKANGGPDILLVAMVPRTARRSVMDPTTTFCPKRNCPARGQTGRGNIGIHSQKEQRFICHECHKTFSATTGTVFYRLRTAAETVSLVVTLLAHGCPVQAIVAALGFDERTIAAWWARSGQQGQAVHEALVEQPRDLGQVQADELRVKKQGGIVWMAMAMMVKTRLWRGGEGSEQRGRRLILRRIRR